MIFDSSGRPLRLKRIAERDIGRAVAWYDEAGDVSLTRKFLDELDSALRLIERCPTLYAIIDSQVRRATLRRFPYVVFYRIESDATVILAIRHQRLRPADSPGS